MGIETAPRNVNLYYTIINQKIFAKGRSLWKEIFTLSSRDLTCLIRKASPNIVQWRKKGGNEPNIYFCQLLQIVFVKYYPIRIIGQKCENLNQAPRTQTPLIGKREKISQSENGRKKKKPFGYWDIWQRFRGFFVIFGNSTCWRKDNVKPSNTKYHQVSF